VVFPRRELHERPHEPQKTRKRRKQPGFKCRSDDACQSPTSPNRDILNVRERSGVQSRNALFCGPLWRPPRPVSCRAAPNSTEGELMTRSKNSAVIRHGGDSAKASVKTPLGSRLTGPTSASPSLTNDGCILILGTQLCTRLHGHQLILKYRGHPEWPDVTTCILKSGRGGRRTR
jgi:hypothetical protein